MASKYKIDPISAATIAQVKRKSAYNLPDRPSERGMKSDEIKHAFYGPITDPENSVFAELARIIVELNKCLGAIEDDTKIMVTEISGGKKVTITFGGKTESFDVLNGGAGVSPTFEVTEISGGHRVTLTDANGTKHFDVKDGSAGANGSVAGYSIELELDEETYLMTLSLKDDTGKVVSQATVDFPLESVVADVKEEDGIITITLKNGNSVSYDITDMVDGLVSQTKHDEDIAAVEAKIDTKIAEAITTVLNTEVKV